MRREHNDCYTCSSYEYALTLYPMPNYTLRLRYYNMNDSEFDDDDTKTLPHSHHDAYKATSFK